MYVLTLEPINVILLGVFTKYQFFFFLVQITFAGEIKFGIHRSDHPGLSGLALNSRHVSS